MKKIFGTLIIVALLLSLGGTALAAPSPEGTKGILYNSDIAADIDGMRINAYRIGGIDGKVFVIAEDLRNYGFGVAWDAANLTLTITNEALPSTVPALRPQDAPGTVAGSVYSSDIVVIANGYKLDSYNIGGRTAVALEDLGPVNFPNNANPYWIGLTPGYSTYLCRSYWNPDARTVSLHCLRPGMTVKSDIGDVKIDAISPADYSPGTEVLSISDQYIPHGRYEDFPSVKLTGADNREVSYYDLNALLKMRDLSYTYENNTVNITGYAADLTDVETRATEPYFYRQFFDNLLKVTLDLQVRGKSVPRTGEDPAGYLIAGKLYIDKAYFDRVMSLNING